MTANRSSRRRFVLLVVIISAVVLIGTAATYHKDLKQEREMEREFRELRHHGHHDPRVDGDLHKHHHQEHHKHHHESYISVLHSIFQSHQVHSQCRECLQTIEGSPSMKWCPNSATPAHDADGQCVSLEVNCDFETVRSVGQCPADDASSKMSCSLCTLDAYTWCQDSVRFEDEYSGYCVPVDPAVVADHPASHRATPVESDPDVESVAERPLPAKEPEDISDVPPAIPAVPVKQSNPFFKNFGDRVVDSDREDDSKPQNTPDLHFKPHMKFVGGHDEQDSFVGKDAIQSHGALHHKHHHKHHKHGHDDDDDDDDEQYENSRFFHRHAVGRCRRASDIPLSEFRHCAPQQRRLDRALRHERDHHHPFRVVAHVLVLAAIVGLIFHCLRRHRRNRNDSGRRRCCFSCCGSRASQAQAQSMHQADMQPGYPGVAPLQVFPRSAPGPAYLPVPSPSQRSAPASSVATPVSTPTVTPSHLPGDSSSIAMYPLLKASAPQ